MLALSITAAVAYSAQLKDFQRNGYAVIDSFAPDFEVSAMMGEMNRLIDAWDPESSRHSVFHVNNDAGDAVIHGDDDRAEQRDAYLIASANQIAFFLEPRAVNATSGDFVEGLDKTLMLNKVGHGLHIQSPVFRAYSGSEAVAGVMHELGYKSPRLAQSMYIFKQPLIGEEVQSHQDSTFLYTAPRQTCVGLLLFLEDADLENGCLWARPKSHLEPIRRRWERNTEWFRRRAANESVAGLSAMDMRTAVSEEEVGGRSPAQEALASAEDPIAALKAAGYVPLPVKAGSLVLVHGSVDHLSLPNTSPRSRHTFQLHLVDDTPDSKWSASNWAQYPNFPGLNSRFYSYDADLEAKQEL
jgi:phytanoyl-CoA hydroxylase